MSVTDKDRPMYCGYCGYRISESDDLAGEYAKRGTSVTLHNACASAWDAEYKRHCAELEGACQ